MAIIKPQLQNIPDFGLIEPFSSDVWKIIDWDYYKNASKEQQEGWKERSNATQNTMDFSYINNPIIREELKYCMYKYFQSNVLPRTLADKYDLLKQFIKFFNANEYESITHTDIDEFENYIKNVAKLKTKINNGTRINVTNLQVEPVTKRSKYTSFLSTCIKWVSKYLDNLNEKDIYKRDTWYASELPNGKDNSEMIIYFGDIANDEFKIALKEYCKHRSANISFLTVADCKRNIVRFYDFLEENYPDIKCLSELNRDILEDYFVYLRTESGLTQYLINHSIWNLKIFFETIDLLDLPNIPEFNLILETDYAFKTEKAPNPFTKEELESIKGIIPKLEKPYNLILFCLFMLGCRVGEILNLKISQIRKHSDGSYYILLYQYKTKAEYEKPLVDALAKLINSQISYNKKRFGENAIYVFSGKKEDKPIAPSTLTQNISRVLFEENILDKDGKPLHCNTHRFRSTFATNLLQSGVEPNSVSKMLGQKCSDSVYYYIDVTDKEKQSYLKPRLEADQVLITNLGKLDDKVFSDYENPIPLCNGWCVKNSAFGVCKKANHCISCDAFVPTFAHIASYERQLQEIEATIAISKANCMQLMLNNALKTKESLEKILKKLYEKGGHV